MEMPVLLRVLLVKKPKSINAVFMLKSVLVFFNCQNFIVCCYPFTYFMKLLALVITLNFFNFENYILRNLIFAKYILK